MTTKTIATYLEDESRKNLDDQHRIAEEADRIHFLQHGHHRMGKQSKLKLVPPISLATKGKPKAANRRSPKTTVKVRKTA